MDSVVASNTNFALSLYKNIRESHKNENVFFSPWSISSALAMVYLGAKGNTAAQMAQGLSRSVDDCPGVPFEMTIDRTFGKDQSDVLHFDGSTGAKDKGCSKKARTENEIDNDAIHHGFQDLISAISKPHRPYLLKTANRIFAETTYNFLGNYAQSAEEFYNAKQQNMNFIEAAEDARKEMNSWVESLTEGKIRDLLPAGSIDALTRLVLVNAVYFKASWEKKFPEENSQEVPFKLSKTETKPVQMMFQRGKFQISYIEELMTQVLELPYVENNLSMIILLPDDINDASNGLEELEAELSFENLAKWTSADMMATSEVEVELPRFKLEEKYNLKSFLSNMGMSDVFVSGKADLTGMSSKSDIFLSQVFHQAFVEVNEEGTEAGAATAAIMAVRSRMLVVKFHADHPFLFFIRHNTTNSILFCGRFCSP